MINALNVMLQISVEKNLMGIHMENAFAILAIMILEVNYAYSALVFGN